MSTKHSNLSATESLSVSASLLDRFRSAQYNFDMAALKEAATDIFAEDICAQYCHPLGTVNSVDAVLEKIYQPLLVAIPDLERRDTIVIAGDCTHEDSPNSEWIGCCGYYTGLFSEPWLDIPATRQQVSMRFHEFYRVVAGRVVEIQAIWDIPEVMMQAQVWPMVPSLGREWHVPAPATQDGLLRPIRDAHYSAQTLNVVDQMCKKLGEYAHGGVAAMQLERYWHPKASWYGPSGIGTGRGIGGFRKHHQIPFLKGLPDRVGDVAKGYLFADNNYVGFTAWPGMHMSISGDGWLGIAPSGQHITMRSLDFWRCEQGLIRENWVLVDLLDVYRQINVDVFARMREML